MKKNSYLSKTPEKLHAIKVTHKDYIDSIVKMDDYQVEVAKSSIPTLNFKLNDINELKDCFNEINILLDQWAREVYWGLREVPSQLKNASCFIIDAAESSNADIEILKKEYGLSSYKELEQNIALMKKRAHDVPNQMEVYEWEQMQKALQQVTDSCNEITGSAGSVYVFERH